MTASVDPPLPSGNQISRARAIGLEYGAIADRDLDLENESLSGFFVGKFVQIKMKDGPYLRIRNPRFLHAGILSEFLSEYVECGKVSSDKMPSFFDFPPIPPIKTVWYKAVGMGEVDIDADKKIMSFYGESAHYGIGPEKSHLQLLSQYLPGWKLKIRK